MSTEDVLVLCESILETQLGEHVLNPVAKVFVRGGPQTLSNIVERTGVPEEHARNVITVLIKHNLMRATLDTYKNVHYFHFLQEECLLRLSFPRYLLTMTQASQMKSAATVSSKQLVKLAILKEIFLAGSLMKSEIAHLLFRQRKRNAKVVAKVKSIEELSRLTEEVCDQLTLEHILVGADTIHTPQQADVDNEQVPMMGAKRKREAKKARKDAIKTMPETQRQAEAAITSGETPLRVNFAMLVALERRDAVIAFARQKFAVPEGTIDDNRLLSVAEALFAYEKQSQNFFGHLCPQEHKPVSDRRPPRLQTVTAQDLQALLKKSDAPMSEAQIAHSLSLLSSDQSELVAKLSFDDKTQLQCYAVNWQAAFKQVQSTLVDAIVAGAYGGGKGAHFTRVLRVLRQQGFMEEKEIVKLTLLPQKNTLAILNRFLADNIIQTQEMPIKGGSSVGISGGLLLYGLTWSRVVKKFGQNLAKTVFNVSQANEGKLGRVSGLTLEMNHLLL